VIILAETQEVPNRDRIVLAANELIKSIAFYYSAQTEFDTNNKPLAAYSTYYSLFHTAQFCLLVDCRIPMDEGDWLANDSMAARSRRWSTPLKHDKVITLLRSCAVADAKLVSTLETSRTLREFFSYGPKLIRNKPYGYFVYVNPYAELMKQMTDFIKSLREWYFGIPEILLKVRYDIDLTLLCIQLWGLKRLYLRTFEYPPDIQRKCNELVEQIVSSMENKYEFRINRIEIDR